MDRQIRRVTREFGAKRISLQLTSICKRLLLLGAIFIFIAFVNENVLGSEYPERPITMMIGMPAGGTIDVTVRALIPEVGKILNQELVPVNKSGGGGAVPLGLLATSPPDGYTICANNSSALTFAPHLEPVTYDPLKDITPIVQFGTLIPIYVVRSDSHINSFKDLVDEARKNPGKISLGHTGVGTVPHLLMELVKLNEKVDIITVPFKGGPPAMAALLGGHVDVCGTSINSAMANIRAGKIKAIGVTAGKRAGALPDVPTVAEQGFPYAVLIEMYLINGPKGLPQSIIQKIEGAFREAMKTQAFKDFVSKVYLYEENPISGKALKGWVEKEYIKGGELIEKAKIGKER
jgi:tripartite-type tricarboxylate transporter receptor subunit TctC